MGVIELAGAAGEAVPLKLCPRCSPAKPLTEFGPDRRTSDGHRSTCRRCVARLRREARTAQVRLRVVSLDERRRPGPQPDTAWYEPFLDHLAEFGSVGDAAAVVGINRSRVYAALARDAIFAQEFQDAKADRVVTAAWRVAMDGWYEPVYGRVAGETVVVGTRWRYDSAMLRLLLQALCPEYRLGRWA